MHCTVKNVSELPEPDSVEFKTYLIGANEAQAQGGQHFDDCRAAVAFDRIVWLQLWHYTLPTHMLLHQGTEVAHHKCTLLYLGIQEGVKTTISTKINFSSHIKNK